MGVQTKCALFSLDKSREETIEKLKKLRPGLSDDPASTSRVDICKKHENLCRAGILKTASREICTGFIRKCIGPKLQKSRGVRAD